MFVITPVRTVLHFCKFGSIAVTSKSSGMSPESKSSLPSRAAVDSVFHSIRHVGLSTYLG
jgi:hypothetical protein